MIQIDARFQVKIFISSFLTIIFAKQSIEYPVIEDQSMIFENKKYKKLTTVTKKELNNNFIFVPVHKNLDKMTTAVSFQLF